MNSIPQLAPVNATTRLVMMQKLNSACRARPAGIDPETAWEQLLARDVQARFFYGVTTTGVFCRPGCASRRPLRANVRFFSYGRRGAGGRLSRLPALRHCATTFGEAALSEKIRAHIEAHLDRPVRLAELGRVARLEPLHRAAALQARDGREPVAIPARAQGRAAARGAQERRACDRCHLHCRIRLVEPRLRGEPAWHDAGALCQGGKGERIGYMQPRLRLSVG